MKLITCTPALTAAVAWPVPALPAADGLFTDLTGRFADLETEMEKLSLDLEQRTGVEFAILVVPDMNGLTVEDYSEQVLKAWGVGKRKDVDNGLLFVLALTERRARLESGYGIEPILPDSLAANMLMHHAGPFFKQDNFHEGIRRLARAVADHVASNYVKNESTAGLEFVSRPTAAPGKDSILSHLAFLILLAALGAMLIFNVVLAGTHTFLRPYHLGTEIALAAAAVVLLIILFNPGGNGLWIILTALGGGVVFVIQYFMSARHTCPQCSRYMMISSSVISPATYTSSGRRRISYHCMACRYAHSREEVIPRLERTSSGGSFTSGGSRSSGGGSSGGGFSFGGGSSGGGGASISF